MGSLNGGPGRRRLWSTIGLTAASVAVLGLLTVFAIVLADTQAKSKRDIESRVHERSLLAAALIDSEFHALEQQVGQDQIKYGAPRITARTMDANRGQNAYLALLDGSGRLLAGSLGAVPPVAELPKLAAVRLVRAGDPYALGNARAAGDGAVVDVALSLQTRSGRRILLGGITVAALGNLAGPQLAQIPGVHGSEDYLVDANDTVLVSGDPTAPVARPLAAVFGHDVSGDRGGRFYDVAPLGHTTWRLVASTPDGPLFAPVSGLRKWVPWLIFIAFAIVAAIALVLGARLLRSAESELRSANAGLARANRELERTNEMLAARAEELARSNAELEQFASIASHDLQEPLRKVRTFTEQLTALESDRLSDRGRDYLVRAGNAAERMQRLIQDLLKFSRVSTQGREFESVDLERVTREVLDDLSIELERSRAVVHVGRLPRIHADPLQIRQLMLNLISNALKFRRDGLVPEVRIDAEVEGDEVRITVADNGIGFEPQYAERIFRVFERLHGRHDYAGTGIGLALCRKIAERHSGSITAEGILGAGSRFVVTLPLDQTQLDSTDAAPVGRPVQRGETGAHVPA